MAKKNTNTPPSTASRARRSTIAIELIDARPAWKRAIHAIRDALATMWNWIKKPFVIKFK